MPLKEGNTIISVVISEEIKDELQVMADKEGRSLSNYVAKVLTDHVEKKE